MGDAKGLVVRPIDCATARATIERLHYSGKVVNNSQLHVGVFFRGRLEGAMQFGPPWDRKKVIGLVRNTPWNGFLELNRMAFSEALPRNSESRALGVVFRLLRKARPDIRWIVSFSDAAQCGDGTIYRAAGFVLTGIKRNKSIVELPDGRREATINLQDPLRPQRLEIYKQYGLPNTGGASLAPLLKIGAKFVEGYQLRYLYFLDPRAKDDLTVPILPFTAIEEAGAGMYRGTKRAGSIVADASTLQVEEGGSIPTPALHPQNSG